MAEKNVTVEVVKDLETTAEMVNGNLVIVREPIRDKNGKQKLSQSGSGLYAYAIKCKFRGKEKKIDIAAKDQGGYENLDELFDVPNAKVELIMTDEVMEGADGKRTSYVSYVAHVIDESGDPLECGVKPQRNSDKDLLKMLLVKLNKAAA